MVYGDSKEDSTYWEGYESVTVEAGFYTTGTTTTSTTTETHTHTACCGSGP